MKQVSPHVFIDPNDGSATVGAIVTAGGVVLVDTPNHPTRAVRWCEDVERLGPVRYLIVTEHHADHTFGTFFFPGTVITHRETMQRFWDPGVFGDNPMRDPQAFVGRVEPQALHLVRDYRARQPEIVYSGTMTLRLGDVTLDIFGMPGHLAMDSTVYVREDRVLFTSDNVFNGTMAWYHDALPFTWLDTLDQLARMDLAVVVPGHGEAAGPEVLGRMRRVVQEAIGTVHAAIGAGLSREQAVERITLADRHLVPKIFEPQGPMLQRAFVARLYDEILLHRDEASRAAAPPA